jgi:hypothetical protein
MGRQTDVKTFLLAFFFGLAVYGMDAVKFLTTRPAESPPPAAAAEPVVAPVQPAVEQPTTLVTWDQVYATLALDWEGGKRSKVPIAR